MTKKYLIIGGTGGIGEAMLAQLLHTESVTTPTQIFASYHQRPPTLQADNLHWVQMDIASEASIKQAFTEIAQHTDHLDWVINCVGMLQNPQRGPEKSIGQFDAEFCLQNMTINALPSLLIAKYIKPFFKAAEKKAVDIERQDQRLAPSIYATISARVGSISDNQIGGWYSYRMSKAALNMGMKTLSIEWSRTLKNVCVVVMQPGTVDSELSKPFQSNVPEGKLFTADFSASHLLAVLGQMKVEQTGSFVDWAGDSIPW